MATCPACAIYPQHELTHGAVAAPPPPKLEARTCETPDCTRTATVEIKLHPRPLPLFGAARWVATCAPHYQATRESGAVLDQRALRGE